VPARWSEEDSKAKSAKPENIVKDLFIEKPDDSGVNNLYKGKPRL
jgi:hypothetical protein